MQKCDRIFSPREPSRFTGLCFEAAEILRLAMLLIALMSVFAVRVSSVVGYSMEPTLHDKQRIVISAASTRLGHEDIVVVSELGTQLPEGPEVIIKRVIGLPGDVIYIDFNRQLVYRNGTVLEEDYIAETTRRAGDVDFPLTVEPGTVFLMGDNRNHSSDSRFSYVGLVDQRYILGRVLVKLGGK